MSDPIVKYYLSLEETIKFIKKHRRGRQCFLRLSIFGYTELPDDNGEGRGYDMTGLVPVGAKQAQKSLIDVAQNYAERRDIRISVGLSNGCIFLG